jgi:hypothetical protein
MKTARNIITIIALALAGAAFAEDGAMPVYTAVNPSKSQELGNAGSLIFRDYSRFLARMETPVQGKMRVTITVAFTNPLLMLGNYDRLTIGTTGYTDMPTRVQVFVKNKQGTFIQAASQNFSTSEGVRTSSLFGANNFIWTGGDLVIKLICDSDFNCLIHLDKVSVSLRPR